MAYHGNTQIYTNNLMTFQMLSRLFARNNLLLILSESVCSVLGMEAE